MPPEINGAISSKHEVMQICRGVFKSRGYKSELPLKKVFEIYNRIEQVNTYAREV